jgi:hypothetical protein
MRACARAHACPHAIGRPGSRVGERQCACTRWACGCTHACPPAGLTACGRHSGHTSSMRAACWRAGLRPRACTRRVRAFVRAHACPHAAGRPGSRAGVRPYAYTLRASGRVRARVGACERMWARLGALTRARTPQAGQESRAGMHAARVQAHSSVPARSRSAWSRCLNRSFPGEKQKLSSRSTALFRRSTMLYNCLPSSLNRSVTEAATSLRTWLLEQHTFQFLPLVRSAS